MTAKAQTEEDRCIQKLVEFRNAAEFANGNAQDLLRGWAKKPRYAVSSKSEPVALAQKRARAKKELTGASHRVRRIGTACELGEELAVECLALVQGAAITLRFPAIHVGDESFPTAHEAAFALRNHVMAADLFVDFVRQYMSESREHL